MLKRIGNVTVVNKGANVGVYYNHTPYRTTLVGFNPFGKWGLGRCHTPGVRSFACGPVVVGRVDVLSVGKAAR